MTIVTHALIQFGLMVLQGVVASPELVPENWHRLLSIVLGAGQSTFAMVGHLYNPNGTSAKVTWDSQKKEAEGK